MAGCVRSKAYDIFHARGSGWGRGRCGAGVGRSVTHDFFCLFCLFGVLSNLDCGSASQSKGGGGR